MDRIDLLLEQRKTLIADTKDLNNNMIKVVLAIIPLFATAIASYFSIIDEEYAPIVRYIVLEVTLILTMVICACLFAANINRDYIAAIDKYLFEKHNISVMFYSGELSRKHTTGLTGAFPLMTGLIGVSVVCDIVLFLFYMIHHDSAFYLSHWYLLLLFLAQIVMYVIIFMINMRRKVTGRSNITEECFGYLSRENDIKEKSDDLDSK